MEFRFGFAVRRRIYLYVAREFDKFDCASFLVQPRQGSPRFNSWNSSIYIASFYIKRSTNSSNLGSYSIIVIRGGIRAYMSKTQKTGKLEAATIVQ